VTAPRPGNRRRPADPTTGAACPAPASAPGRTPEQAPTATGTIPDDDPRLDVRVRAGRYTADMFDQFFDAP